MTREEKVNTLKAIIQECEEYQWWRKATLSEIIEDLEYGTCEDTVSREQALLALTGADLTKKTTEEVITLFNERIQALPLITPAQRWIPCSENGDENNGKI